MSGVASKRFVLAGTFAALAVIVGGVAYAYWSGPGSGAGSAATGTTVAVTLGPGTAEGNLYPGGRPTSY